MRTPNSKCLICSKPFYRRPCELAKTRHSACMAHRAEAQKVSGITEAQQLGLSLGREKGTNHRSGYKHKEESKKKISESHKQWHLHNAEKVAIRGEKIRGEKHYNWKGGVSKLNVSIRQMTENRRWMDSIKERDKKCRECGAIETLEAHHIVALGVLIEQYGIKNRDAARKLSDIIWGMDNGITLCQSCHFIKHNRKRNAN